MADWARERAERLLEPFRYPLRAYRIVHDELAAEISVALRAEHALAAEAVAHLGDVLSLLSDLDEGDRCEAFDSALAFYNQNNPDAIVEPSGIATTYLVHKHPVLGICELTKRALGITATEARVAELEGGLRTIRKIARQRRTATKDESRADSFASIYRISRTLLDAHGRQDNG